MPGYVQEALQRFQHPAPSQLQHEPHSWTTPAYGSKVQYTLQPSTLPILNKKSTRRIRSINGTFLYYARSIDACILPEINEISTSQAKPTEDTNKKYTMLMNYTHSYPNTVICYHASDTRMHIDSNAAYLIISNIRSRGAEHFYLSNYLTSPVNPLVKKNGAILTQCITIKESCLQQQRLRQPKCLITPEPPLPSAAP